MKNDALLVSRVILGGDRDAFGQLVERYQSSIRRFLLHLCSGDESLSQDLAQETFLKAWLKIESFRAAANFSTWLYRIAFNTFCDYTRARKPMINVLDEQQTSHLISESKNQDFALDLPQALLILREEERTAMLLFYMEDLTVERIARIMNCPGGTVKSHLARGREKLMNYFKRE